MVTQHTPGRLSAAEPDSYGVSALLDNETGEAIGEASSNHAPRIVSTWNSHDDLLAALKASVLKLHKIAYPISVEHTIEFEDCRAPECVQARTAIAKAEEGS